MFIYNFAEKNITFGPLSRYRTILPAAVANQIAGNARIPPAHERKKNKSLRIEISKNWILYLCCNLFHWL